MKCLAPNLAPHHAPPDEIATCQESFRWPRRCGARWMWTLALALGSASPGEAQVQHPSRVELAFNRLYNYEEMTGALRELTRAYPELLSLQSIGKSSQGRDLWLVTVSNPETGSHRTKPAMYIDGNIHGNEVQAAEVCLYTIWYLTKSHGKVAEITDLVDRVTFYIVPMINPDGRAYWFAHPNTPHSSRGNQVPVDDDHDGVADEDPPDDLDGDGFITRMRIRDPNGAWRVSREDPRLLERVPPGETGGEYTLVGSEGIDNDGDGRINEDGPGGYDMNRNWPADWQPNHIQGGAGDYPLCFPETRAVADFILAHPNIAGVQAYHNTGGMILRGPGVRYVAEYPPRDLRVYDYLGELGESVLPFYRYMVLWKDLYPVHGGFINWTYEGLGIFSFTNELFTRADYFKKDESQGGWMPSQLELLRFNDLLAFGQNFVDWHEVDHPTYGKIEVGGFGQYSSRVPPPFMIEEMCHRNMAFTLHHARAMPELEFARRAVEPTGDGTGTHSVTVEVRNRRVIPTISETAHRNRVGLPDTIELQPADPSMLLEILAGGELVDRYRGRIEAVEREPGRIRLDAGLGSEGARTFRWFVRGAGEVLVTYRSEKGGKIELRLKLPAAPAEEF